MIIYSLFYGALRSTYVFLTESLVLAVALDTTFFVVSFLIGGMFLYPNNWIVCWKSVVVESFIILLWPFMIGICYLYKMLINQHLKSY